ncbi:hypothetical protein ANN_28019 [Periplaneta americana]|uniref:Integrase catalytic domain-containing protein n=1 Tax=Periplaneta americana TaxID=6978 RepID=A0ABQ8RUQ8_PERAM|nr:hypothetical protein ANN_28019 [Periplaneta americana]
MGIRFGLVDKASARRAENPGSNPGAGENFSLFHSSFISLDGAYDLQNLTTKQLRYHPQSNGICERMHKLLVDMLSHYVNKDERNWDKFVPYAIMAYPATPNTVTKYSPYYLVYGRDMKLPIEDCFVVNPRRNPDQSYELHIQELENCIHVASQVVIQESKGYDKSKEYYNRRAKPREFQIGDLVYLYDPIATRGKNTKFAYHWQGPFEVIKKLSQLVYSVKIYGESCINLHVNRLKEYKTRHTSSDDESQKLPQPESTVPQPVETENELTQGKPKTSNAGERNRATANPRNTKRYEDDYWEPPSNHVARRSAEVHENGMIAVIASTLAGNPGTSVADLELNKGAIFLKDRDILLTGDKWTFVININLEVYSNLVKQLTTILSEAREKITKIAFGRLTVLWNELDRVEDLMDRLADDLKDILLLLPEAQPDFQAHIKHMMHDDGQNRTRRGAVNALTIAYFVNKGLQPLYSGNIDDSKVLLFFWLIFILIHDRVVMDVIKSEPKFDPLAVQPCDDTIKEEENPSPDEGNLLDLHVTRIKEECVDDSYEDHNSEIKFDEIILPNNFPIVKCEAEEDLGDLNTVKDERKLEVSAEENEILPDSRVIPGETAHWER